MYNTVEYRLSGNLITRIVQNFRRKFKQYSIKKNKVLNKTLPRVNKKSIFKCKTSKYVTNSTYDCVTSVLSPGQLGFTYFAPLAYTVKTCEHFYVCVLL